MLHQQVCGQRGCPMGASSAPPARRTGVCTQESKGLCLVSPGYKEWFWQLREAHTEITAEIGSIDPPGRVIFLMISGFVPGHDRAVTPDKTIRRFDAALSQGLTEFPAAIFGFSRKRAAQFLLEYFVAESNYQAPKLHHYLTHELQYTLQLPGSLLCGEQRN
jgi:hypothetical protein